jgi:hypothetical protein
VWLEITIILLFKINPAFQHVLLDIATIVTLFEVKADSVPGGAKVI